MWSQRNIRTVRLQVSGPSGRWFEIHSPRPITSARPPHHGKIRVEVWFPRTVYIVEWHSARALAILSQAANSTPFYILKND